MYQTTNQVQPTFKKFKNPKTQIAMTKPTNRRNSLSTATPNKTIENLQGLNDKHSCQTITIMLDKLN
jgi:hypothetical protein